MSLDAMHDALNLLDDDMVEAVDVLRNNRKKKSTGWVRLLALAACLFIGVVSLYMSDRLFSTQEDGAAEYVGEKDNELYSGGQEGGEDQLTGGTGTVAARVLLEIKALEETGFTGEVAETGEVQAFSAGDILKVTYAEKRVPDSIPPLQEGDRVWVTYSPNHGEQNSITAHKVTVAEDEE